MAVTTYVNSQIIFCNLSMVKSRRINLALSNSGSMMVYGLCTNDLTECLDGRIISFPAVL